MKFNTLSHLDPKTAAGILAQAALQLTSQDELISNFYKKNLKIIGDVLAEARDKAGIKTGDFSEQAKEKLADILDEGSDTILEVDEAAVQQKIDRVGSLPSDLYRVVLDQRIYDVYGQNGYKEIPAIEATVHSPDAEKHFVSRSESEREGFLSIFAKQFVNKYLAKTYTLIVIGLRNGPEFNVKAAYRFYGSFSFTGEDADIIDILKLFSRDFGIDAHVKGYFGSFFYEENVDIGDDLELKIPNGENVVFHLAFSRDEDGKGYLWFLAVDRDKYIKFFNKKNN